MESVFGTFGGSSADQISEFCEFHISYILLIVFHEFNVLEWS